MQKNARHAKFCRTVDCCPLRLRLVCLACTVTFGLALANGECQAAQKSLFILTGLQQWAELSYKYDGSSSGSDRGQDQSSQQQRFEETYHAGIGYAVYSRRLLHGRLIFDLGANQDLLSGRNVDSGSSSSGFNFEYKVDGNILDRSFTPVSFYSSSQNSRVQNPFSRSYDLKSDALGVTVAIKNRYLPARFFYSLYGNETDGLNLDREQTTETLRFTVNNTYKDLSRTEANLFWVSDLTDFRGGATAQSTDTVEFNARNTLTWGKESATSSLDSSYRRREEAGDRQSLSSAWNEDLNLHLGKALQAGLGYSYSSDRNPVQSRLENKGRGWLQHRLFQSLTTHLELHGDQIDYSTGKERNIFGTLSIGYHKKLPGQSTLQLGLGQTYGVTDRDLDAQQLFVSGEPLTVKLFDNFLQHPDIISGSIAVFNADRTIQYLEGSDYTIRPVGRQTELLFPAGSPINTGDVLSIDYRYQVSNSIKYSTDTRSISASLLLFQNLLRFYANFIDSSQKLLSGRDDAASLNPMRTYIAGCEATLTNLSFGGVYTNQDSVVNKFQSIEGVADYQHMMGSSRLMLRINDRYTMYEQASRSGGVIGSTGSENSLNISSDYRKPVGRNASVTLTGNYLNLRGESRDRNDIALGLNLEMRIGKFEALLLSSVSWQMNPGATDRADHLFLKLRRYF